MAYRMKKLAFIGLAVGQISALFVIIKEGQMFVAQ
jgi:hypothetical protein